MNMNSFLRQRIIAYIVLVVGIGFITAIVFVFLAPLFKTVDTGFISPDIYRVRKFSSDTEFQDYMASARSMESSFFTPRFALEAAAPSPAFGLDSSSEAQTGFSGGKDTPERYSSTNVQVVGIDEPDIVKTNGTELFVSTPGYGYPIFLEPMPVPRFAPDALTEDVEEILEQEIGVSRGILPREQQRSGVHTVTAFPPEELSLKSTISKSGDLLLADNTLVVFSGTQIFGYDISNPEDPKELWSARMQDNSSLIAARLYNGHIYLVEATWSGSPYPCPFRPLSVDGDSVIIPCTEIYHPIRIIPADSTYTVMKLDPLTGGIQNSVSFVASRSNTTVSMSENALFVAYQKPVDNLSFVTGFLGENTDLVPQSVLSRLKKLQEYDIGHSAKMTELSEIWTRYTETLNKDEQLRVTNELQNRLSEYHERHKRTLLQTGLIKIMNDSLAIAATGSVPGKLLNQFSMDEYQGNLRLATTIESVIGFFSSFGSFESENDLYVLDKNLNTIGFVQGLGRDERIFSARFIDDKGYLVTFKQIDPFFVFDLSDPRNPRKTGELKIPGFSSYLHPINNSTILGVGREGSQVKATLFDVSDPSDPKEKDTYRLSEHWSDIQNTHHAFLLDDKFSLFFLPGASGGYVFSYKDNTLELKKAVSGVRVRRAVFIDDYLYIVSDDRIVVLDEQTWDRVGDLRLE